MHKTEGLIAAAFTPFYPDGTINFDMIPVLTEKLINDGVKGIFVCGSNGEGPNMTTEERMQVAAAFIQSAKKRLQIIVHVGHSCITEAKLLAAHAAECGADAFSSVAGFYFKPTGVKNLAASMAEIASGAPGIPFYYYHIPHLTGLGMDMIAFLEEAHTIIPNLAGIKYTASTIQEFQACIHYQDMAYDMMFGLDELLLPALAVGAKAAIGSTYTFAAPVYLRTVQLFNEGKVTEAQENHLFMVDAIRAFIKYPPIPAQKAIMKMLGWDLGPARLPLKTLCEQDYQSLYNELKTMSFFERVPVYKSDV